MGTRKSVDKILDDAANILETRGFTTTMCFDPETGGYCALGAIARAVYPKNVSDLDLDTIAMEPAEDWQEALEENFKDDPKFMRAVELVARTIKGRKTTPDSPRQVVFQYNDRVKSPKLVVKMLRRAAELARKEASA